MHLILGNRNGITIYNVYFFYFIFSIWRGLFFVSKLFFFSTFITNYFWFIPSHHLLNCLYQTFYLKALFSFILVPFGFFSNFKNVCFLHFHYKIKKLLFPSFCFFYFRCKKYVGFLNEASIFCFLKYSNCFFVFNFTEQIIGSSFFFPIQGNPKSVFCLF